MIDCKFRKDKDAERSTCAPANVEVAASLCRACLEASGGDPDPERPNWFLGSAILVGYGLGRHKNHDAAKKAQEAVYRGQSAYNGRKVIEKPKALAVVSAPRKPCFYRGEFIRSEECSTCSGRVLIKHYACNHPSHETTTIAECRKCADHETPTLQ